MKSMVIEVLPFANIETNPVFKDETQTVDITYRITKGDKIYFGTIEITGNVKTRDNVIRENLKWLKVSSTVDLSSKELKEI